MRVNMKRLKRFNELELCLMNQYPSDYKKRWLGNSMFFCQIILKEEKSEPTLSTGENKNGK